MPGGNAVKILQRLVQPRWGFLALPDGVIGPQTLRAAQAGLSRRHRGIWPTPYGIARRNYYYALADKPAGEPEICPRAKDGGKGGWITRAEAFIAPRYHLSGGAASGDGWRHGGDRQADRLARGGEPRWGKRPPRGWRRCWLPSATRRMELSAEAQMAALAAVRARNTSRPALGWFDRLVNGLNRLAAAVSWPSARMGLFQSMRWWTLRVLRPEWSG
jgi:hypothetical protein